MYGSTFHLYLLKLLGLQSSNLSPYLKLIYCLNKQCPQLAKEYFFPLFLFFFAIVKHTPLTHGHIQAQCFRAS